MTYSAIDHPINALDPATVVWTGCDHAIVGHGSRCGQPDLLVYDYTRLLTVFTRQGMSREDAREWVDVNIVGAWVGEHTPITLYRPRHLR